MNDTTAKISWPFVGGTTPRVVSSDDCHLITDDGRRILDAAGGAIVANIGHANREVVQTIAAAAGRLSYVVPPWRTPEREALVERLMNDWLPPDMTRVHLTSGGSEGNDSAVKIALQHHQAAGRSERVKVISRTPSYHGTTLAMAAISGHAARKRGLTGFLVENPKCPAPYPLRAPAGVPDAELGAWYVAELQRVIDAEGADTVAALLLEPISGASGGAIVPPDDYLPAVRKVCDTHGILLISDEVMTGFGRTGTRFGVDHWQVMPDIIVGGKGLGGGYAPITGVFATEAVAAPIIEAGMDVMFHTFGALPVACAAADKVLEIMQREQLVARAARMGEYLRTCLDEALGQHPNVAEVRGRGLLQAIEVVANRDTLERYPVAAGITGKIVAHALENDVFFYPGGTGEMRDIVLMGPPFTVTRADVDRMVEVLASAVRHATGTR